MHSLTLGSYLVPKTHLKSYSSTVVIVAVMTKG